MRRRTSGTAVVMVTWLIFNTTSSVVLSASPTGPPSGAGGTFFPPASFGVVADAEATGGSTGMLFGTVPNAGAGFMIGVPSQLGSSTVSPLVTTPPTTGTTSSAPMAPVVGNTAVGQPTIVVVPDVILLYNQLVLFGLLSAQTGGAQVVFPPDDGNALDRDGRLRTPMLVMPSQSLPIEPREETGESPRPQFDPRSVPGGRAAMPLELAGDPRSIPGGRATLIGLQGPTGGYQAITERQAARTQPAPTTAASAPAPAPSAPTAPPSETTPTQPATPPAETTPSAPTSTQPAALGRPPATGP